METKSEEFIISGYRKAISNAIIRYKTIVDTQNKTYKNLQTIFGIFKVGEFQQLPKLDYVLLFQSSFRPNCEACALDEEEYLFYQVSLVYRKNRRIIVHESKKISEALQISETLHKQLQLPLKDASVRTEKARWKYAGAESAH